MSQNYEKVNLKQVNYYNSSSEYPDKQLQPTV